MRKQVFYELVSLLNISDKDLVIMESVADGIIKSKEVEEN